MWRCWLCVSRGFTLGMEPKSKRSCDAVASCSGGSAMFTTIGARLDEAAKTVNLWTDVYGLARSLIAFGTLLTLFFNNPGTLFPLAAGLPQAPICASFSGIGLFCLIPNLDVARWVAFGVLLVAASGWRPRYTCIPHWWVTFSFNVNAITLDGGDQVSSVLTLLMIPLCLLDRRTWHWQISTSKSEPFSFAVAYTVLLVIRLQVGIIYFHASVGKMAVEEWINGTAAYYWFTNALLGSPSWMEPFVYPMLTSRVVVLFSWMPMLLELVLMMALVAPKWSWRYFLWAGISFHALIAISFGLVSFGIAMFASLILYLRPVEQPFNLIQPLTFLFRPRSKIPN